ncbi:MAG: peptidoglycan DD-metalloendopeptidase family protein, partial [Patescibacteria group bacterium]
TALEKKIAADEAAKKKKQEEQARLATQLAEIDTQIQGVQGKLTETQTGISQIEAEIAGSENAIRTKEAELVKERDDQAETLRNIYEQGSPSTLELLVAADSLSDVLAYHDYLDAVEGKIEQQITEIDELKAALEARKADLEKQRNELQRLEGQQQAYRQALGGQRTERNHLLANAKSSEEKIAAQIAESQKVYSDVNNELTKLMEEAKRKAAQRARGEIPKGVSNIGFQWPTSFKYISTNFGGQTPFQSFHTGLDLPNYAGTEIVASADGVVNYIGQLTYGYGNFVVISHNARFATLYGHCQSFAQGITVGQTISRGDLVCYMGTTGWSTGPHLHFEIREYGVPVDPRDYLPNL